MAISSVNAGVPLAWPQVRNLLLRRRWWFFIPFVAGWLATVSLFWLLPPRFRSESLLLVEQQSVPSIYVQPNVAFNPDAMLQDMGQQVLSDDRLAQVVRDFGLYSGLVNQQGMDAALAQMRADISIQPVSLASLPAPPPGDWSAISIAYTTASPELAQRVASRLTNMFIQENLRATQQASDRTTAFLAQQVDQARQQVQQAEQQLQQYESAHLGVLPGQGQANLTMVMTLQSELGASLEALDRNQQEIATDRSLLAQSPTPAVQQRSDELATLRAQLQTLRGRYTDRYPDVVRLEQQIAELEAAPAQATTPASTSSASTSLTQLRSRYQAAESLLPQQQAQVARLRAQLGQYEHRLTLAPVPAAQVSALNTRLQQAQTTYQADEDKLNNSQMASQLEQSQGGAQFRLVNAPVLPRHAVWPNPAVLALLGLVAGLVLGVGVCALAEIAWDRIGGEVELMAMGVAPVLANVPPLFTRGQSLRRHLQHTLEFVCAFVLVAGMVLGNLWLLRRMG